MRITITQAHPLMLAPLAVALAACGDDPAPEASSSGEVAEATGEVLGGSISDDMLPLEEVRSQSPLAPRASGAPSSSGGDSDASDAGDASEDEAETAEVETSADAPAPETPSEPAPEEDAGE